LQETHCFARTRQERLHSQFGGQPTAKRDCFHSRKTKERPRIDFAPQDEEAAKVVAPYFRQDEKLIRYVLTQPPDRVSYRMLTPTDEDLQKINDMAVKTGILERQIAMKDLIDRQFIPLDIKPANIDPSH